MLSIAITLAGGIAVFVLPVALYPPISPPTVQVDCNYPGASAEVVSEAVATPIEQQVNGVENMMYMSSQCTNDGTYNLTVTFKHGVDLNMAQVLVQNRVALALPLLPDVLKQTGVNVKKKSPDILMAIALNSPPDKNSRLPKYDQLFLSNYATLQVKDELARLPGVSDVTMLGQRDYSMRVWLDPDKLAARSMSAGDVIRAIREQNAQVPAGQIGQPPSPLNQPIQIPLDVLGRLRDIDQFQNIIVKSTMEGRVVRLKDVARVELGAKNQDISGQVNGVPSVSLAIFQLPDANALDTAVLVKEKMKELEKSFPEGLKQEIRYNTTPFISESIGEVFKTLREAVILVAVVVLLFLQNWRSAVIPLVAVPVAIIGTFAVMAVFGFSLNNLTLFGLVLAIGIVVDDAIVVVEAVEHHIERGLSPRDATIKAMDEVSGPVIAIGLVLSAVFVPCAFITGIVGQFFRQFALTIAASTIISAFNSLTLSPALAALLLRPRLKNERHDVLPRAGYMILGGWLGMIVIAPGASSQIPWLAGRVVAADVVGALIGGGLGWFTTRPLNWILSKAFGLFNRGFAASTNWYTRAVGGLLRVSALVVVVYGGLLGLTYWGFITTPTGFIPSQDMGYLLVNVQLPDSASSERTREVMSRLEKLARTNIGVKFTQAMSGQSLLLSANGSNFGSMFLILDSFEHRPSPVSDRFFQWCDDSVTVLDQRIEGFYRFLGGPPPETKGKAAKRPATFMEKVGAWVPLRRMIRTGLGESDEIDRLRNVINRPFASKQPMEKKAGEPLKAGPRKPGAERVRKIMPAPPLEQWIRDRLGLPKYESLYGEAIAKTLSEVFKSAVPEATITVLGPPPVRGVGRAGGFKIMIKDRGDNGSAVLQGQTDGLTDKLKQDPRLFGMTSVFRANVPQLYVDVDRKGSTTKGVALQDLFDTLRVYLGSRYVNDFNLFGRTWQVVVQADSKFRNRVDEVHRLKVRNAAGTMVPVGALAEIREVNGPLVLTRYNMYPAAPINGSAAPGVSSGEAIAIVQGMATDPVNGLAPSMSFEWTELAYLELQAGNTAMIVFGCAVVMVFLVLAAQYESWSLPLAIIMVVPMCLLSAVAGVKIAYQDVNIFTQIGFVVLVGLASKNAILIVEFAKARREQGETREQAALDACRLRLRPIVMTSLAFILGVAPLILGQGAGAEMRRTLGITVFSGMLGVTIFGIFLTPVFFVVVDRLSSLRMFRSGPIYQLGNFLLVLLTFGLWLLVRELYRARFAAPRRRRLPATPPVEETQPGELVKHK